MSDWETIIAKNKYRTWERTQRTTFTFDNLAINYIKREIGKGRSLEEIVEIDEYQGDKYKDISHGPYCARLPKGKLRIHIKGQGERIFSVSELYKEALRQKQKQAVLL